MSSPSRSWWREPEVLGLVLLVIVAYFLRAGELPIRGEEPTRALVALEMVASGDWLVQRREGEVFLIRPPLQPWLIAATCKLLGNWDPWYVRLHSLVSTLLTTILIYGYSRNFLGRLGALSAALAFATLADMFQMGRQAETEACFIFFVSASLIVWHWGLMRRCPETTMWCAGYAFAALAMMTKGLQAPTYFCGTVGLYLIFTGQWRKLLTGAHLAGIAVGVAIVAAWVVPYARTLGIATAWLTWFGDPALHLHAETFRITHYLNHMVELPAEILAGTTPWCLLLLLYVRRDFRESLGAAGPYVFFATIAMAVAFPTTWLHPDGRPRFFAPLFPCMAVLIGVAVERCASAAAIPAWRTAWNRYLGLITALMLGSGLLVVLMSFSDRLGLATMLRPAWIETPLIALAYLAACAGLAAMLWNARQRPSERAARLAVIGIAAFLVMSFIGIVHNIRVRLAENPAEAMAELKAKLPPGQKIIALGSQIDCLFPYYYRSPIVTLQPWPERPEDVADGTYFCMTADGASRPKLPFSWEEIGIVPLDRNRRAVAERIIVVGRRAASPPQVQGREVSREK